MKDRIREIGWLFRKYMKRSRQNDASVLFGRYVDDVVEYSDLYTQYCGKDLTDARIVEIGFGTRPLRLATLLAQGYDVSGIDMDCPLLHLTPSNLMDIVRANGVERAVKSLVRFMMSDRKEWNNFCAHYGVNIRQEIVRRNVLHVDNASSPRFWEKMRPVDLLISEDVFEHIDVPDLESIVAEMARCLSPGGLALIRPNIFTGITGGHRMEWNMDMVDLDIRRATRPWEHLRGNKAPVGTVLNGLTRAQYRVLFREHFKILEERVRYPELGRKWLTGDTLEDLGSWPEEELFSNNVLFVLQPL
ncbi:MAG: class I SAM-dependent methyltransferase [Sphingomonadales bacterium]